MDIEKYTGKKLIKNLVNILMPLLIYFSVFLFSAVCLSVLLSGVTRIVGDSMRNFMMEQEATVKGIVNGIAMLFGTVPLLPAWKRETGMQAVSGEKSDRRRLSGIGIFITITLAFTTPLAVNALFIRTHFLESSETYSRVADSQYSVLLPVGLLLYGIVSPLAEELVFRGILYNRMKRFFSVLPAVLLSAMLFGMYHGNLVQGIYGFMIGTLIAYIYEKFSSFLYPVLFHAAANVTAYMISGNQDLYEIFMTPVTCIACAVVSIFLILFMRYSKSLDAADKK